MNNDYKELLKFLKDSLESNTLQQSKLFTKKKIFLDTAFSENDENAKNKFSSAFRGFWVVDSSDKDFVVNMFPNVANNYGDQLPLKPNMTFDFGELVNGCKFDFEAQSGKWIEVLFFHKGFAQIGNQELDNLDISLGTSIDTTIFDVSTTSTELSTVSQKNKKVTYVNIGMMPVFIGNDLDIASDDFQNECFFLPPEGSIELEGSKQISCRTYYGTGKVKVIREY